MEVLAADGGCRPSRSSGRWRSHRSAGWCSLRRSRRAGTGRDRARTAGPAPPRAAAGRRSTVAARRPPPRSSSCPLGGLRGGRTRGLPRRCRRPPRDPAAGTPREAADPSAACEASSKRSRSSRARDLSAAAGPRCPACAGRRRRSPRTRYAGRSWCDGRRCPRSPSTGSDSSGTARASGSRRRSSPCPHSVGRKTPPASAPPVTSPPSSYQLL